MCGARGWGTLTLTQMSSFVPAEVAEINVVDNILCKVDAGDLQVRDDEPILLYGAHTASHPVVHLV